MQLVSVLSANLLSKSLKKFLEAHPADFTIRLGAGSKWTFSVHDASKASDSSTGASGSGASDSATAKTLPETAVPRPFA